MPPPLLQNETLSILIGLYYRITQNSIQGISSYCRPLWDLQFTVSLLPRIKELFLPSVKRRYIQQESHTLSGYAFCNYNTPTCKYQGEGGGSAVSRVDYIQIVLCMYMCIYHHMCHCHNIMDSDGMFTSSRGGWKAVWVNIV